jgi:hypothetical protein
VTVHVRAAVTGSGTSATLFICLCLYPQPLWHIVEHTTSPCAAALNQITFTVAAKPPAPVQLPKHHDVLCFSIPSDLNVYDCVCSLLALAGPHQKKLQDSRSSWQQMALYAAQLQWP